MNRADLIAAMQATASAPPKKCTVEGWGTVYLKPLTVEQCDLQQQESETEGKDRLRIARGAARVICDKNGALLLDPENPEDLELLAKQPWQKLQELLSASGVDNATSEAGREAVKKD